MAFEKAREATIRKLKLLQSKIEELTDIRISIHVSPGFRICKPKVVHTYGYNWFVAIGFISFARICTRLPYDPTSEPPL